MKRLTLDLRCLEALGSIREDDKVRLHLRKERGLSLRNFGAARHPIPLTYKVGSAHSLRDFAESHLIFARIFTARIPSFAREKPMRHSCSTVMLLSLFFFGLRGTQAAGAPDHAIVPAFERFADDIHGGQILLGELNCLSCHKAGGEQQGALKPKQAPVLTEVGSRVRPEYLRQYLADPQSMKAGSTMPNLFAGANETETKKQVEALVHFLASTGRPKDIAPRGDAVKRGNDLFHKVGCVACHNPQREEAKLLATSVPLGDLSKKYSILSLTKFLQDPLKVRPSGRMPHLNLNPKEAQDIVSYLLKDISVYIQPNVKFKFYEGGWDKLPDFSQLEPKETGVAPGFDVTTAPRSDQFGMVFEAFLRIEKQGSYTFHLGSDDGSRLLIDGIEVVNVDGIHPLSFNSEKTKLEPGIHKIVVEYFEQGGEEVLKVEYEGKGVPRQSLDDIVSADEKKFDREPGFVLDENLVNQGRKLFAEIGCASCHSMQYQGEKIKSVFKTRGLAELKSKGGCINSTPATNVPHFALNDAQRSALAAAIEVQRDPSTKPPSATESIDHTLATLNCYACHQRGERGGAERERYDFFQGNQPEMGDEGRIPPLLTGVGAKLKTDWMKHVLNNGAKDRPYMFTRMPQFGENNVGQLVAALEETDKLSPSDAIEVDLPTRRLKATGRMLVGSKGTSCIKCHTFGNSKATGIQSISMTTMARRLKQDWFEPYMLNPITFRPGTRMPAAWPGGQTFFTDVLDGDAKKQIHAVWVYLSDGDKAAIPEGLGSAPAELIAEDEAIMYRNFIEGAGPRAIGVGYPEKVNLAFDANKMAIAMLWHGAFIDASRHWNGRGQGFQPPLGDNVLSLPTGAPLAILQDPAEAWPTKPAKEIGYRFRGYRLAENRRPVFLYSLGDVAVEDYSEPTSNSEYSSIRRTLTFANSASTDKLYCRSAVAGKIEDIGDGWFSIDDDWKIRIESDSKPEIRSSGNRMELVVPVKFNENKAKIVQEFSW